MIFLVELHSKNLSLTKNYEINDAFEEWQHFSWSNSTYNHNVHQPHKPWIFHDCSNNQSLISNLQRFLLKKNHNYLLFKKSRRKLDVLLHHWYLAPKQEIFWPLEVHLLETKLILFYVDREPNPYQRELDWTYIWKKLINVCLKNLRQCLHEEENTKNICEWIWRFNVYYMDFFMCCWGLHNCMSSKHIMIFHI